MNSIFKNVVILGTISLIALASGNVFGWSCGSWYTTGGNARNCDARDDRSSYHLGHAWKVLNGGLAAYPDGQSTFFHPNRFQCTCGTSRWILTEVTTQGILPGNGLVTETSAILCPARSGGQTV